MALMNQTEYGRHVGVTRQRVGAYIDMGQIPKAAIVYHGKRKLINSEIADPALKRSLDPAQTIKANPQKYDDGFDLSPEDREFCNQVYDVLIHSLYGLNQIMECVTDPKLKESIRKPLDELIAVFRD